MNTLSIIIPVYNEAANLPQLVEYLRQHSCPQQTEIIVVDGYSTDDTAAVARNLGVQFIHSPRKGRAVQFNTGAAAASGSVLYFLHADSFPPAGFSEDIFQAVREDYCAGCYRLRFDHLHLWLRLLAWFTRFPFTFLRFGDQSLFVTKSCFEQIGGYNEELILLEDQDIVRRIKQLASFKILPRSIITSHRKYLQNGFFRLQGLYFLLYFLFVAGCSQEFLVKLYRKWIVGGKI